MSQAINPILLADWTGVVFIHFRIDPRVLAPVVPFELDLFHGDAFVSLVAFTQRRLRPAVGGKIAAMLSAPLAEHEFLNLRTYVRVGPERGICFLAEWIQNRLSVLLGPRLYGLPYRLGILRYRNAPEAQPIRGRVIAGAGAITYHGTSSLDRLAPALPGTRDHFLLERYLAYTHRDGVYRRFQVSHEPWPQRRVNVRLSDHGLLGSIGSWTDHLEGVGANFSPGVCDVGIGPPRRIRTSRAPKRLMMDKIYSYAAGRITGQGTPGFAEKSAAPVQRARSRSID